MCGCETKREGNMGREIYLIVCGRVPTHVCLHRESPIRSHRAGSMWKVTLSLLYTALRTYNVGTAIITLQTIYKHCTASYGVGS